MKRISCPEKTTNQTPLDSPNDEAQLINDKNKHGQKSNEPITKIKQQSHKIIKTNYY